MCDIIPSEDAVENEMLLFAADVDGNGTIMIQDAA